MRDPTPVTPTFVQSRVSQALQMYVGPRRPHSVAMVAEETGIDPRTVGKYAYNEATPTLQKFLALGELLGAKFVSHVLESIGMAVRPLDDSDSCSLTINAKASKLTAAIAEHLIDGRICSQELEEQRAIARDLRAALDAFLRDAD